jgi:tripartite-type tricarboxylate transporter receptor subunit TctC
MKRRILLCASLAATVAPHFSATANEKKPIRVLTSSIAGGVPDVSTRELVRRMAIDLNTPMYVENKPGGFGAIWANEIKRSAPDGLTLGTTYMAQHSVFTVARNPAPYDALRDCTNIGTWTEGYFLIVATAKSGYGSLKELLNATTKVSQGINYGVTSLGSPGNLLMELLKSRTNAAMNSIFYKPGELQLAALRGDVGVIVDGTQQLIPHIQSGQFVPLAIFAPQRISRLPNVPTLVEAGIPFSPGLSQEIWHGLVGPAGMPEPIVSRLHASMKRICDQPDFIQWNEDAGRIVKLTSPSAMTERVRREISIWSEVISKTNIRLDS